MDFGFTAEQHRLIECVNALVKDRIARTVRMFKNNPNDAIIAAHEAKWMAKETLEKFIWSSAEICGSTALFIKHPLERFYRDMHLHMMHGRHDIAAQIVGASELGEPYDTNRNH